MRGRVWRSFSRGNWAWGQEGCHLIWLNVTTDHRRRITPAGCSWFRLMIHKSPLTDIVWILTIFSSSIFCKGIESSFWYGGLCLHVYSLVPLKLPMKVSLEDKPVDAPYFLWTVLLISKSDMTIARPWRKELNFYVCKCVILRFPSINDFYN